MNNANQQSKIMRSAFVPLGSPSDGNAYSPAFLEITGREGSTSVCRKQVNSLEDISDSEVQKLLGIARRLPAVAFDALCNPLTVELVLNPNEWVWQECLGESMKAICIMRESEAEEFIRKVAGCLKRTITRESPILEGVLPLDDSRFIGLIPPVVTHPAFDIRRRAVRVFTLDDYVATSVMTARQCELIRSAIREKQNVLIIGGTGSGKTTLGNAVLNEITVQEPFCRQVIIEDTAELQSTAINRINLQTTPDCSLTELLKASLRLRPDRIIVGEVRGREAFELVQAWNTGHPGGVATLHANDCITALRRLKALISQHPFAPRDIEPDIALAVNLMIGIAREGNGRRVTEIVAIQDYDPNAWENYGYRLVRL